jgi:hypothetical protein
MQRHVPTRASRVSANRTGLLRTPTDTRFGMI